MTCSLHWFKIAGVLRCNPKKEQSWPYQYDSGRHYAVRHEIIPEISEAGNLHCMLVTTFRNEAFPHGEYRQKALYRTAKEAMDYCEKSRSDSKENANHH